MFVVLAKERLSGSFMRLLFQMAGNTIRPDARAFISNI